MSNSYTHSPQNWVNTNMYHSNTERKSGCTSSNRAYSTPSSYGKSLRNNFDRNWRCGKKTGGCYHATNSAAFQGVL